MKDIIETAEDAGTFSYFLEAVRNAGLVRTLSEPGPYTIFVPWDEAFRRLPDDIWDCLQDPDNVTLMICHHVIVGLYPTREIEKFEALPTYSGHRLKVVPRPELTINGVHLVSPDIECHNGIIHVVDDVILPSDPTSVFSMPLHLPFAGM